MDARCKNCKHWGDEIDRKQAFRFPYGNARECKGILPSYAEELFPRDKAPARLAYTEDASGCFSVLWTYPEFGCVLFEPLDEGK
jgi:hypothetical protein